MAEFLTTTGTAYRLERLVEGARSKLTLISPYLQLSRILLERFHHAAARGVRIAVVCRSSDLRPGELAQLQDIPELSLLFMENVHAKCYLSDIGVVVTSMNLYHHSEQTNREMGVYFDASETGYVDALKEVESILAAAKPAFSRRDPAPMRPPARADRGNGYCLRCHRGIELNPQRPLCIDCYRIWAEFSNPDYTERFCHDCGIDSVTSFARPLCQSCYSRAIAF